VPELAMTVGNVFFSDHFAANKMTRTQEKLQKKMKKKTKSRGGGM
jgi:hypothetical protein